MKQTSAFSLVELSIVLVILGLLVGGILGGQSLLRASEMRGAITELGKYTTALTNFREQYSAIPGDMPNATSYWQSLGGDGSDATCQNLSATGLPTCNGNGNGDIGTSVVTNDERLRTWQHLANAGLIEGSYTGKAGSSGVYHMIPGTNVPASKVGNNSYHILNGSVGRVVAASIYNFAGQWGIGDEIRATTPAGTYTAIFSPKELWNIDAKTDDGKPAYGMVYTYKNAAMPAGTTCLLNDGASDTAAYNASENSKQCIGLFTLIP